MSKAYEFAISKKLSIVLALCCGLAAIMLFVAGTLSGLLLSPRYLAQAQAKPASGEAALQASAKSAAAAKPEASAVQQPPGGTPPAVSSPTAPSGQAVPSVAPKAVAPAATPAIANAASFAATASLATPVGASASAPPGGETAQTGDSAKSEPASAPDVYPVSLAVQVGSFTVEQNANRLAESLKQLGYPAEIVQRLDSRQRTLYIVRLGPYHKWDTASGVALRLASSQDVRPIVGPM